MPDKLSLTKWHSLVSFSFYNSMTDLCLECIDDVAISRIIFSDVTKASAQKKGIGLQEKSSVLNLAIAGKDLIRLLKAAGVTPICPRYKCFNAESFPFFVSETNVPVKTASSESSRPILLLKSSV